MASGFGVTGKKGRCYDVWMEFSECMSHCTMPADCTSRRDDYFECLHHRKEVLFSTSPFALALISAPSSTYSFIFSRSLGRGLALLWLCNYPCLKHEKCSTGFRAACLVIYWQEFNLSMLLHSSHPLLRFTFTSFKT